MEERKYRAKGTRVLADGTIKEYYYNKSYKVKNGVGDNRHYAGVPKPEKLSPAQKEEAWQKYLQGVTIKRIAADFGVSYTVAHKCISKKREDNVPAVPPPVIPPDAPPAALPLDEKK